MKREKLEKVTIILPFYHESIHSLKKAIQRISEFFEEKGFVYEIIVSQNGRPKKIALDEPHTKVVFEKKRGLGYAIKNATTVATGDYMYFLSLEIPFNFSDLNHILKLYDKYDLLIGSKLHEKSVYEITGVRKLASSFLSLAAKIMLPNFNVKDPNGTLFGRADTFKKICKQTNSNDFFFNTEFVYGYSKMGLKIHEVPITYTHSPTHSSVRFSDGLKYLISLLKLRAKK